MYKILGYQILPVKGLPAGINLEQCTAYFRDKRFHAHLYILTKDSFLLYETLTETQSLYQKSLLESGAIKTSLPPENYTDFSAMDQVDELTYIFASGISEEYGDVKVLERTDLSNNQLEWLIDISLTNLYHGIKEKLGVAAENFRIDAVQIQGDVLYIFNIGGEQNQQSGIIKIKNWDSNQPVIIDFTKLPKEVLETIPNRIAHTCFHQGKLFLYSKLAEAHPNEHILIPVQIAVLDIKTMALEDSMLVDLSISPVAFHVSSIQKTEVILSFCGLSMETHKNAVQNIQVRYHPYQIDYSNDDSVIAEYKAIETSFPSDQFYTDVIYLHPEKDRVEMIHYFLAHLDKMGVRAQKYILNASIRSSYPDLKLAVFDGFLDCFIDYFTEIYPNMELLIERLLIDAFFYHQLVLRMAERKVSIPQLLEVVNKQYKKPFKDIDYLKSRLGKEYDFLKVIKIAVKTLNEGKS